MNEHRKHGGALGGLGGLAGSARGRGAFGGGPMRMMQGEKPKNFAKSMKSLLGYIKHYRVSIIIVFFFSIFSTVFGIVSPLLLGNATTLLFEGAQSGFDAVSFNSVFVKISEICALLLFLYISSAIFGWLQGLLMSSISRGVSYRLRKDLDAKIHRLPFSFFDTRTSGEILSYVTNDVDTITQSVNQSLTQIVSSVTTMSGILVIMVFISIEMTVAALVVFPISFFAVKKIVAAARPFYSDQQEELGHLNGHIAEMFTSHTLVKAFNGEASSIKTFNEHNEKLFDVGWKMHFLSGLIQPVTAFLGNVGFVIVCIVGAYLAVLGRLPVGHIQAFVQYVRQVNQPVMQIANISNIIFSMAAASERIFAFLSVDEEAQSVCAEENCKGSYLPDPLLGQVDFSHIHFGYSPEKIIINDFSASIKSGQKVAIVGPTGAGKTTMVKLLMRFYEPSSGFISVDGVSISSLPRTEIRKAFGMVLQDTWLYHASIRENIRYGCLNATDEMVENAAKAACVDHFIRLLPEGYDFMLNEEATNISRGQKQLLTIARAFLSNPSLLILDEATSSVDTLTEIHIQRAMKNLMHGRTSFIIAHRLSTIRDADVILVMNKGDIVEQGTHMALLEKKGFYAELYESQFETELRG